MSSGCRSSWPSSSRVVTAFSYLELVTKYPKAAGAALYTHKAFGIHFITFIVAFTVMCSGITSASTASRAFAANLSGAFQLNLETGIGISLVALAFMAIVAAVNFRGVGESVKANVVLTMVELTGLLIIIFIGLWAIAAGQGDVSRVTQFATSPDTSVLLVGHGGDHAGLLRHGRLRGFGQHGRGMQEPVGIFPKVLLAGLFITGVIYVLVSISAITLVTPADLGEGETPLLKVVQAGAPNFPLWIFGFITMFAVANSALINMLMASRLVYGMSREHVLPPIFGKVHARRRTPYLAIAFTTLLAFALITVRGRGSGTWRHDGAIAAFRLHDREYCSSGPAKRKCRPRVTSARRRFCRSSARSAAPSSQAPGRAAIQCNTRSPGYSSASVSCYGLLRFWSIALQA